MGNSARANGGAGPGSQPRHKLEPHMTAICDRPIQAPRAEGDGTYVSTGKMLHLFHAVSCSLPVLLRRRRFERPQRLKWGRESGCVPCTSRARSGWESGMVRRQHGRSKTCIPTHPTINTADCHQDPTTLRTPASHTWPLLWVMDKLPSHLALPRGSRLSLRTRH